MDRRFDGIVADPRWFPFRFDRNRDELHFVWIPRETHDAVTFLSDVRAAPDQIRVVPRRALGGSEVIGAPLHFVLHSGLGGSTLLARALAAPGIATTFKEPPILTDIVGFSLVASEKETAELASLVATLLARPFGPGEAIVVKVNSVGNGVAAGMAAPRPTSRILCLSAPLEEMLASLARRGLDGRLGGRKLFIGLRNSRLAELGFDEEQLFQQSDLQLAALGWLAIQRIMVDAAERLGPEKVSSIASGDLLNYPRGALAMIARHLNLPLDIDKRVERGVFTRHAKTGEPFDAGTRAAELTETLKIHGREIGPIVEWARRVAEANAIACHLPHPPSSDPD